MSEEWRPDWRNEYPDGLTTNQWRWQFLRRDPDYSRAWDKVRDPSEIFWIVLDGHGTTTQDQTRLAELINTVPKPKVLRGLYVREAQEFGCRCIVDPALPEIPPEIERGFWSAPRDYDASEFNSMLNSQNAPTPEAWERWRKHIQAGRMVAEVYDLRLNLASMVQQRVSWLRVLQRLLLNPSLPTRTRQHRKKWARYLRVLDAKATNATGAEIARVLDLQPSKRAQGFDPDRLVSETLKQAKAVQVRLKSSA